MRHITLSNGKLYCPVTEQNIENITGRIRGIATNGRRTAFIFATNEGIDVLHLNSFRRPFSRLLILLKDALTSYGAQTELTLTSEEGDAAGQSRLRLRSGNAACSAPETLDDYFSRLSHDSANLRAINTILDTRAVFTPEGSPLSENSETILLETPENIDDIRGLSSSDFGLVAIVPASSDNPDTEDEDEDEDSTLDNENETAEDLPDMDMTTLPKLWIRTIQTIFIKAAEVLGSINGTTYGISCNGTPVTAVRVVEGVITFTAEDGSIAMYSPMDNIKGDFGALAQAAEIALQRNEC